MEGDCLQRELKKNGAGRIATIWTDVSADVEAVTASAGRSGIALIEDLSPGARAEPEKARQRAVLATAGCFSFIRPRKLSGALGDWTGPITTHEAALSERIRKLRQ